MRFGNFIIQHKLRELCKLGKYFGCPVKPFSCSEKHQSAKENDFQSHDNFFERDIPYRNHGCHGYYGSCGNCENCRECDNYDNTVDRD